MLHSILVVSQITIAILLILFILMQDKGTGLSATFGGTGNFYASKRGLEKILSKGTVLLSIGFFVNAVLFLVV